MQQVKTHSVQETEELASRFAASVHPGDVIAYTGGLGAGKTAFTRGLCRGLGLPPEEVSSPTFALVNEYRGNDIVLYHFDMYRISSFEDLVSTGFFDYLDDPNGILAIEWSENIPGALPDDCIRIDFHPLGETERLITFEGRPFDETAGS